MYQHPGNRPVNLDLRRFRFPLNAYVSILHRITGVILIMGFLMGLFWLNRLVLFPGQFAEIIQCFDGVVGQLFLFGLIGSLWYHWLAGFRHLVIEHNFFNLLNDYQKSTASAKWMLILFVAGLVMLAGGMWL